MQNVGERGGAETVVGGEEAREAAAWAAVLAAWENEAAHRAYLEAIVDLDGLARAGRRYRAVLAERPGDAIAARHRDEIVRRAMVQGLAQLPRTAPPRTQQLGSTARILLWTTVGSTLALVAWKAFQLLAGGGAP